jgi:hypothetical protein
MSRFITPNYYSDDPEMASVKGGLIEIEDERSCLLHTNRLPPDTTPDVLEDSLFDNVYKDFSTKYVTQSSMDSTDVTSILSGYIYFGSDEIPNISSAERRNKYEDDAFANWYITRRKIFTRKRLIIVAALVFLFVAAVIIASLQWRSRNHQIQPSTNNNTIHLSGNSVLDDDMFE